MVSMWALIYEEGGLAFKSLGKKKIFASFLYLIVGIAESYLKVCTTVLLRSRELEEMS